MFWRGWRWMGAVGLVLCASPAHAGEPSEADRVRLPNLLKTGAEAAKTKHWDACAAALGEAATIDGAATISGDLGLCEEAAGKLALAFGHLRHALEAAPAEAKEPWNKYRAALARVRERVAVVIVTAYPSAARILLDGRPLGVADGRAIAVEPGTHVFAARLEGYKDASESRTMSAGDVPQVHFQLEPKPKAPAPVPRPPAVTRPVPPAPTLAPLAQAPWYKPAWSPRGVLVTLTYASAATLLVSGETAFALELDRQSMFGKLDSSACGPDSAVRPPQCAALRERTEQRNLAADVLIGATIATGLLAGATGLANVLDRSPLRPAVALTAGPYGGGIAVGAAW